MKEKKMNERLKARLYSKYGKEKKDERLKTRLYSKLEQRKERAIKKAIIFEIKKKK
jgi:hypothetical protein